MPSLIAHVLSLFLKRRVFPRESFVNTPSVTAPLGIYLHWPFCRAKCPYCDFNVHLKKKGALGDGALIDAFLIEIREAAKTLGARSITSVYFGGGTPSLMTPERVGTLLEALAAHFEPAPSWEVSLEANPEDAAPDYLAALRAVGVNRLSLGVQSLEEKALHFLGRAHDAASAIRAIRDAQRVFDKVSFDLIYARPQQTSSRWRAELRKALHLCEGFEGAHLSLYQLTIEKGTRFFQDRAHARFAMPEDSQAADLYSITQELCEEAGLPSYEISNHARGAKAQSRHNLLYWNYGEYLGLGPGAHGRILLDGARYATMNERAPKAWVRAQGARARGARHYEALSPMQEAKERLLMGLRLSEGMPLSSLPESGARAFQETAGFLRKEGLLARSPTHLRATRRGRLLLDGIVAQLLKSLHE